MRSTRPVGTGEAGPEPASVEPLSRTAAQAGGADTAVRTRADVTAAAILQSFMSFS
jgi:hypothetical protein